MSFCDFCDCRMCREGDPRLSHAPTADGGWICDVCYTYDVCTSGPNRAPMPCEDNDCKHRPTLVGPWEKRR